MKKKQKLARKQWNRIRKAGIKLLKNKVSKMIQVNRFDPRIPNLKQQIFIRSYKHIK